MQTVVPLEVGQYYHVYNRGVDRANIFIEERNYHYFMQLYAKHVVPVADTFAYCLLRNHFHLLVRIRAHRRPDGFADRGRSDDQDRLGFRNRVGLQERVGLEDRVGLQDRVGLETLDRRAVSHAFNNWLNAYAKGINKGYGRTGGLFQHHFGRLPITSNSHFATLVRYIHHNPQKHGFEKDFREWPYSSYRTLLSERDTLLERGEVLSWFGGPQALREAHAVPVDEASIAGLVLDDEVKSSSVS